MPSLNVIQYLVGMCNAGYLSRMKLADLLEVPLIDLEDELTKLGLPLTVTPEDNLTALLYFRNHIDEQIAMLKNQIEG